MTTHSEALVARAYEAFNSRDLDAAVELLSPDVDWPNGWEGGRLRGRDAVRDYWTRQWAAINPTAVPLQIIGSDNTVVATVDQLVWSLDGELLDHSTVNHSFQLSGGLIVRMDISDYPVEP